MAATRSETLPFPADALHINALSTSKDAELNVGGAEYYGFLQAITEVGRTFLAPGSRLLDLRCDLSLTLPIIEEHEDLCRFTLLSSDPVEGRVCFDSMRTRIGLGFVDAGVLDLHERFPDLSARMILAVNALSDLSSFRRMEIAEAMHRRLERCGAAVVMESVGMEADIAEDHQHVGGISRPKRRPWSAAEWESLFRNAGFRTVVRIWSGGDRVAWMIRK